MKDERRLDLSDHPTFEVNLGGQKYLDGSWDKIVVGDETYEELMVEPDVFPMYYDGGAYNGFLVFERNCVMLYVVKDASHFRDTQDVVSLDVTQMSKTDSDIAVMYLIGQLRKV